MKTGFSQLTTIKCDSEQPHRMRLIIAWSQVQILPGPPAQMALYGETVFSGGDAARNLADRVLYRLEMPVRVLQSALT